MVVYQIQHNKKGTLPTLSFFLLIRSELFFFSGKVGTPCRRKKILKWSIFFFSSITTNLYYANTPSPSLPAGLAFDLDRLGFRLLSPRDLLFDRLLLFRLRDCRYLRCNNARRRLRLVNNIPVNITKDANNNIPPVAYFNLVIHVLPPPKFRLNAVLLDVWLRRSFIAELSEHSPLSIDEQLSDVETRYDSNVLSLPLVYIDAQLLYVRNARFNDFNRSYVFPVGFKQ